MEPDTRYTLVAIIVLLLFGMIIFSVLWLAGFTNSNRTSFYTVYFREHSLSGLQIDGSVTMRGIKVGTVSDFEISRANIEHVKVLLAIDADTPVKTDTEAIVTRNLLTGIATIELVKGSQESSYLTDAPAEEFYPVIKEGKAPLEKLATSASTIIERASANLERLEAFLSDENVKSFTGVLSNLEEATEVFAKESNGIQKLIERLDQVFRNLNALSKTLENESSGLGKSLRESATQLTLQIAALSRELSIAARSISQTAERFNDPKGLIFGPADRELGPGESRRSK